MWSLPRRRWTESQIATAVEELSSAFRKDPSVSLFPAQAMALAELAEHGGLVGPLPVGSGKTLLSLLASWVVDCERFLIILPAKLEKKTHIEVKQYREQWHLPSLVPTISVEKLQRKNQADYLERHSPDLIIIDEAHRLANISTAAAAKRVDRYVTEHQPKVVVLTGTLVNDSLNEYAHFLRWSLRDKAPVPLEQVSADLWSDALSNPPKSKLGCFDTFGSIEDARAMYRARLLDTPGVVSLDQMSHEGPLEVSKWNFSPSAKISDAMASLQELWCLPDGQEVLDGLDMTRHAYTVALGFWLRWKEPGPEPWMAARSVWARFVRDTIKATADSDEPFDTAEQVEEGVKQGVLKDGGALLQWTLVKPIFTPETVVEWIDETTIAAVMQWCQRPGIVWYHHRAIGQALAAAGLSVFGRQGLDGLGRMVENAPADLACAASIKSSGEGRNLQQFNRSLVLEPPGRGATWEQLLGRLHRSGQTRPVRFEVMAPFEWHDKVMDRACNSALYIEQTIGQKQKLLQGTGGEWEC